MQWPRMFALRTAILPSPRPAFPRPRARFATVSGFHTHIASWKPSHENSFQLASYDRQGTEFAARAKATWARLIGRVYAADPLE